MIPRPSDYHLLARALSSLRVFASLNSITFAPMSSQWCAGELLLKPLLHSKDHVCNIFLHIHPTKCQVHLFQSLWDQISQLAGINQMPFKDLHNHFLTSSPSLWNGPKVLVNNLEKWLKTTSLFRNSVKTVNANNIEGIEDINQTKPYLT